jgi:hypothetical protein
MDLRDEIIARVQALSPELQRQVLQFVTSLASSGRKDSTALVLLSLGGSLDPTSAREMREAIEEGCEQVDADQW